MSDSESECLNNLNPYNNIDTLDRRSDLTADYSEQSDSMEDSYHKILEHDPNNMESDIKDDFEDDSYRKWPEQYLNQPNIDGHLSLMSQNMSDSINKNNILNWENESQSDNLGYALPEWCNHDDPGMKYFGDNFDGDTQIAVKNTKRTMSTIAKQAFENFSGYAPPEAKLQAKLHCFLPEYLPVIGSVDLMFKIPRPDGIKETIGLTELDEQRTNETNAKLIDLELRGLSADTATSDAHSLNIHTDRNELESWLSHAEKLNSEHVQAVRLSHALPDASDLLLPFPNKLRTEISSALKRNRFEGDDIPTAGAAQVDLRLSDLEDDIEFIVDVTDTNNEKKILTIPNLECSGFDVEEVAKIACALVDIPVYEDSLIESLHTLFSAYLKIPETMAQTI